MGVEIKGDGSPVTRADRAAERILVEQIRGTFPDDGILGEETGERQGTSGRRWILDPIDGTKSFVQGVPLCGTHGFHGFLNRRPTRTNADLTVSVNRMQRSLKATMCST